MPDMDPQVLLLIILLAVGAWAAEGIWTGAKKVEHAAVHAAHVAGCGVKHVLTGTPCATPDEPAQGGR